jgi:simple sugar transport system permease protein
MRANTAITTRLAGAGSPLRGVLRIPELAVGTAVVAAFIMFVALDRSIADPVNVMAILARSSTIGFAVLGMSVLMLVGEVDLTVGIAAIYATVTFTTLEGLGWPEVPSLLGTSLVMLLIGWLNSVLVLEVRLPSFLATLCTSSILGGLLYYFIPFNLYAGVQVSFAWLGASSPLPGVPWIFIIFAVVVLLGDLVIRRTRLGAALYATGANPRAAEIVGIDTGRLKMLCFMFASFCGGLASFAFTATIGAPLTEEPPVLWVMAIALIGGCSLAGGVGSLLGGFLGTLLLMVIRTGLGAANLGANAQAIMVSGILIAAILLEAARRKGKNGH